MATRRKLSPDELKSIVASEIDRSIGYYDSEVAEDRRKALRDYFGEPYGDEREGRSQVVSRDVMDTIEWMLPALMRIFTSTEDAVEFEPAGPEDEAFAEQATDYVNYIFTKDNNGFLITYNAIKDGLLSKVGVVKHYWEDREEWTAPETWTGLDDDTFAALVSEDEVEVIEHTAHEGEPQEVMGPDGMPMMGEAAMTHDVKLRRLEQTGRVRVESVPPEEFLVSTDAKNTLDTARFAGHRRRATRSSLLEMGFSRDLIDDIPRSDPGEDDDVRMSEVGEYLSDEAESWDQEEVWITEAYIRIDMDGDGVSELVRVYLGGDGNNSLLDHEEVDRLPFSAWTPIIVPHRFYGISIADLTSDIQRIKTALMRQMLDNLQLSNNPRKIVKLDSLENPDDLLDASIGGIIRLSADASPDAITSEAVPFVAEKTFGMLEYLDGITERRTGVGGSGDLDANALQNVTAAAASMARDGKQQRLELVARVFAETLYRDLFRNILRLVVQHQDRERVVRLRNEWVAMDPRHWNAKMDVTVNIGLGNGNRDMQQMHLAAILEKQESLMRELTPENPLVGFEQYHNTLSKMVETAGFKNTETFFTDPANYQPPPPEPPQPSGIEIEYQMKMQLEQEQAKNKREMEALKAQTDAAMAQQKHEQEMALARMKAEIDAALQRQRYALEGQNKLSQTELQGALRRGEQQSQAAMNRAAQATPPTQEQ